MQITATGFANFPFAGSGSPYPGSPRPQAENTRPAEPIDRVQISASAVLAASAGQVSATTVNQTNASENTQECAECAAGICTTCKPAAASPTEDTELSEEEQAQVAELKERDAEVRAHEAAHAAAGGSFAGSPSYSYQTGPDGKRYAIGGEVSIDTSPIKGDPQATIDKLRTVQAAALAPAEPSGQDRKVAQAAAAQIRQAEAELAAQKADELKEQLNPSSETDGPETSSPLAGTPETASSSNGSEPSNNSPFAETGPPGQKESTPASRRNDQEDERESFAFNPALQNAADAYQKIAALV
ncbi:MAG: catalase [Ponticaulis sp.]|nr:catalase [Ponticaulis sp.]